MPKEATESSEPQSGLSAVTGGHEPLQCRYKLSTARYEQEHFWLPVRIRGDALSRWSWSSGEHRRTKIRLAAKQLWIQDTKHALKHKHCPANHHLCHVLQEGQTKTIPTDSALQVGTEDGLWKWRRGTSLLLQRGESPGYGALGSWMQRLLKHISSWNSQYQVYCLLLLLELMQCLLSSWEVTLYKNKQKCQNKNRCLEQPRESKALGDVKR